MQGVSLAAHSIRKPLNELREALPAQEHAQYGTRCRRLFSEKAEDTRKRRAREVGIRGVLGHKPSRHKKDTKMAHLFY